RAAGDERALADAKVLRDRRETAEGHEILDDDVPCELHAVGDDAARSDDDVVRDVAACHEKILRADARRLAPARDVHGDVLAEDVLVLDPEADPSRRFTPRLVARLGPLREQRLADL